MFQNLSNMQIFFFLVSRSMIFLTICIQHKAPRRCSWVGLHLNGNTITSLSIQTWRHSSQERTPAGPRRQRRRRPRTRRRWPWCRPRGAGSSVCWPGWSTWPAGSSPLAPPWQEPGKLGPSKFSKR